MREDRRVQSEESAGEQLSKSALPFLATSALTQALSNQTHQLYYELARSWCADQNHLIRLNN